MVEVVVGALVSDVAGHAEGSVAAAAVAVRREAAEEDSVALLVVEEVVSVEVALVAVAVVPAGALVEASVEHGSHAPSHKNVRCYFTFVQCIPSS